MKDVRAQIEELLAQRILVLDGAWGVLIHRRGLSEGEYRGERFRGHHKDVQGDPDLLNLTHPEIVSEIHDAYFAAGADLATTNTFTATSIGQGDYDLGDAAAEMSLEGARLARRAADEWTSRTPEKPRFVAGSLGPLNVTLSLSPRVDDAAYRAVTFDQVRETYEEQIAALRDGGVDLLMVETIFDTLNAKAAIVAAANVAPELPLWLSFTAVDRSGRNLSGQTAEAFWISVEHAEPLIVGVNCSLGATEMRPFLEGLANVASTYVSCHPNAGLPNALGLHDEEPGDTSRFLRSFAEDGLVNLVGGCCGTTPEHTREIARAVEGLPPRRVPEPSQLPRYSGLEPFVIRSGYRVRRRRRADERHRVGEVPAADRGRRLPGRRRRRHRAGAWRREPPRREHGRRPARRGAGDDEVPQPDRDRARGGPAADHGRQLSLLRARGRASSASRARGSSTRSR